MRKSMIHKANGFTLIEIMIVIAIIGTLTAIATPNYFRCRQKTMATKAILEIKRIEKELMFFQMDNVALPDSLAEIGLDSLRDPWGNPYQYLKFEKIVPEVKFYDGRKVAAAGSWNTPTPRKDHHLVPVNTDYDLYSMGPDGKSLAPFTAKVSRDDIVRANNGEFVGLVSNY